MSRFDCMRVSLMSHQDPPVFLRFESFQLDLRTRELRKEGRLIKLQDQPSKLLAVLASRAGELVTRAEIEKALWNEDEFVEFEHSINTAVRKIREALGDDPEKPRFVETLPRKGYRFIATVDALAAPDGENRTPVAAREPARSPQTPEDRKDDPPQAASAISDSTATEAEFVLPRNVARALFLTIQVGYLALYCSVLYWAEDVEQTLERALRVPSGFVLSFFIILAMCGIAVRLYLLSSVGLKHPAAGEKFRRLFPVLFVLDTLWATSPLLLVDKIGYGLALGAVAGLAYLPFSQRTLMQSLYREGKSTVSRTGRA